MGCRGGCLCSHASHLRCQWKITYISEQCRGFVTIAQLCTIQAAAKVRNHGRQKVSKILSWNSIYAQRIFCGCVAYLGSRSCFAAVAALLQPKIKWSQHYAPWNLCILTQPCTTGSDEKTNEFALEQWSRQRKTTITAAAVCTWFVKTRTISAQAVWFSFRALMQEEEAVEYCICM